MRRVLERDINGGEDHLRIRILLGVGVRGLSPVPVARPPRSPDDHIRPISGLM